jgi:hypothetical protein
MPVPRLDLPSGGWVEYRDKLMADDKIGAHEAVEFRTTGTDRKTMVQHSTGATVDLMRLALLERIITAWSLTDKGIPIPSMNLDGQAAIRKNLDIDDMNALEEAVEPLMEKVAFSAGPNRRNSSASS